MIPILFESTETQFTSNGLCRLIDCTSCLVTEKRNGLYEVEFKYPTSGRHFAVITVIVSAVVTYLITHGM